MLRLRVPRSVLASQSVKKRNPISEFKSWILPASRYHASEALETARMADSPQGKKHDSDGASSARGLEYYVSMLKGIVNLPDKILCCIPVRICSVDDITIDPCSKADYQLALVARHDEACLVLLEIQPPSMPPIVHKVLPIFATFEYSLAQASAKEKPARSEFMATLSVNKDFPASVLIQDEQDLTKFLEFLKPLLEVAKNKGYKANSSSHQWVEVYNNYSMKKETTCQSTLPLEEKSAIPYVLPIKRSDSTAFVKLRRAATIAATKIMRQALPTIVARDHWVNARLRDREDAFVTWETARIFAGTWNVHGSLPTESLAKWLQLHSSSGKEKTDPADFYVIGLQEMETNKDAYVRYDPTKENAWVKAIFDALGPHADDYYKVAAQQLVTILIIVVARKSFKPFISDVETNYVGVGLMNMMGNKGGAGVRLRFHDSYLCFLTSHLAAFNDQVDRRNQDFSEICKRLTFPNYPDEITRYISYSWNDGGDEGVSFLEDQGVTRDWTQIASVFHCDHLIWMGDLNYRVNLTEPEIKSRLRQKQLDMLLEYDQLSIERQAGRTFPMFEEGKIEFMPTYKYDSGTNRYDSSPKRRAPSWTDRILWKKPRPKLSEEGKESADSLVLKEYNSCMDMMLSDHKPVYAIFEAKIRKINSEKQKKERSDLLQQLKETQDNLTKGEISTSFVEFGDVHFMEYKEKTIILENTGQVLAPFRFIASTEDGPACPPWLRVHPLSGVIGPGERVIIHFEILIDPSISTAFNEGDERIDSILILRLENGKDFFIVVSGNYHPTCFGVKLERLALMSLPVSEVSAKTKGKRTSVHQVQQATFPKELWSILNFLWNKSMLCQESLFMQHGDRDIADYIRRCLDTGDSFQSTVIFNKSRTAHDETEDGGDSSESSRSGESGSSMTGEEVGANSMVDVLIAFLECLPEPVVPTEYYKQALAVAQAGEGMNQFLQSLPNIHHNVLFYIMCFLKDAIAYAPESCKTARKERITELFTILLRPPIGFKEQNPALAEKMRIKFISQLLS